VATDSEKIEHTRFDGIHECDGRPSDTHRRTPHDGIGRACVASRGKNELI